MLNCYSANRPLKYILFLQLEQLLLFDGIVASILNVAYGLFYRYIHVHKLLEVLLCLLKVYYYDNKSRDTFDIEKKGKLNKRSRIKTLIHQLICVIFSWNMIYGTLPFKSVSSLIFSHFHQIFM